MTKRKRITNCIFAALIFCGVLNLSGCSLNSLIDELRDPEKLSEELHQNPRFWNDATALSEKDGLYTLYNEFFQRKPYNNLVSFGDNVLLIGQGTYINEVDDIIEDEEQDFEYSFDLYDPWKNTITASINHDDINCNDYQVVGNTLFLINSYNNTIDIYDQNLSFLQRINLSSIGNVSDLRFFPSYDDNHFLAYNYIDQTLSQVDKTSLKSSVFDFNMYNISLEAVSDDGKEILVSGLDKDSLHYVIHTVDTFSEAFTNTFRGSNYYPSDVSDDAFVTTVDSVWLYHNNSTDEDVWFQADEISKSALLPDNSVILNSANYWEEDEDSSHTTKFCHLSDKGETLSSFSFDCGVYNQPGYVYFSTDYAYLPAANCIMFLNYTTDVNPYILIWNLNTETKSDAIDIQIVDDQTDDTENTEASIVDFGDLEEANKITTELEDKYDIDIFIGEEVPSTIDVFETKSISDPEIVTSAVNQLNDILSVYPENFFSQLCYGDLKRIQIYLAGEITSDSEDTISSAGGFVTVSGENIIMVLDTNQSWAWDYTVHHEISHMVDRRLDFRVIFDSDSIYSDEKWNSYNPDGFEYLNSYAGYIDNPDYLSNMSYFIDDYGTTYATEDRAEIFGKAMDDYKNDILDAAFFQDNKPIKLKLAYYCQAIREGFNTTGWPEVMPWEAMLYK